MKLELQKIKKCWNNNQNKISKLTIQEQDNLHILYDDIHKEESKYCQQEDSLINGQLTPSEITIANHNLQIIKADCLDLIQRLSKYLSCDSNPTNQPTFADRGARPGAVSIRPNKMENSAAKKLSDTGKRQAVKKY